MRFPVRSTHLAGAEISGLMMMLKGQAREDFILDQVTRGGVPDFMRETKLIDLTGAGVTARLEVAPNYLCLGTNEDYVFAQCNILTAQAIADVCEAMLPTRKIVDEIWRQSQLKLAPMPWGPPYDASMMSSERFLAQSKKLKKQRDLSSLPLEVLTAGQFKDYILVKGLAERMDRTCIYGWHQTNGKAIQDPQLNAHERTYVDYSQCPRLVAEELTIGDDVERVAEVMASTTLWRVVMLEGPSNVSRVPGT